MSVEDGALSKGNLHRSESNCGIAPISTCEVFRFGSSAIGFVFMHYAQGLEDRHFRKPEIPGDFQYRCFFLAVIVLPAGLDLSGRIEPEQQNNQDKDDRRYAHGFGVTSKKSPWPRRRLEYRATGLRRRTRRKCPSLSLRRVDLSSYHFLTF